MSPVVDTSGSDAATSDHTVSQRFWSYVNKSGPVMRAELGACWVWLRARNRRPDGSLSYGKFAVAKRTIVLAHRFAWAATHGSPGTSVVCHRCDNPICVRPDHLFIGSQADNLRDMRAKGRGHTNGFPTGAAHPLAKATPVLVDEIKRLRASGLSYAKVGAAVGLHASTVHDIVNGKTWRQR